MSKLSVSVHPILSDLKHCITKTVAKRTLYFCNDWDFHELGRLVCPKAFTSRTQAVRFIASNDLGAVNV